MVGILESAAVNSGSELAVNDSDCRHPRRRRERRGKTRPLESCPAGSPRRATP